MIGRVALLLGFGAVGGILARRLDLPGGSLLGAMLTAGTMSLITADARPLPEGFRSAALVLLGIAIASSLQRDMVRRIWRALPVACVGLPVLLGIAGVAGWLLYAVSDRPDVSLLTVMLGTMPGGASGLTAAAYDLGADMQYVASLHMVRLLMVYSILPLLLRWQVRRQSSDEA